MPIVECRSQQRAHDVNIMYLRSFPLGPSQASNATCQCRFECIQMPKSVLCLLIAARPIDPPRRRHRASILRLVLSDLVEIPAGLKRDTFLRSSAFAQPKEPRETAGAVRVHVLEAPGVFFARAPAFLEREVRFLLDA